ncbi:MAG: helix-turn-helix transcriptional regulator [Spirochaetia bacterium]|nr:helix-turn-helix transcriptional regulator [Spirochaetia bacterium]
MNLDSVLLVTKAMCAGVLCLQAVILILHPHRNSGHLVSAAFAVSIACYMFCATVHKEGAATPLFLPLYAGCISVPVLFFLFSRVLFSDQFRFRPIYWVILVTINVMGYVRLLWTLDGSGNTPGSGLDFLLDLVRTLLSLGFILSAVVLAYSGGSDDLVEDRRKFRVAFLAVTGTYTVIVVVTEAMLRDQKAPAFLDALHTLAMAIIVFFFAVRMLALRDDLWVFHSAKGAARAPASSEATVILGKLTELMEKERFYRQENLTIRRLASHLGEQEYKIRRAINGALGHRNFSEYLNRYRIAEACEILDDPAKKEIPVIRIAMDLGYGSLAPFNRAFKKQVGKPPTVYRQESLGASS